MSCARAAAVATARVRARPRSGLQPGVTAAVLRGRFAEAAAAHGVTTPAFEAVATTAFEGRWWSTPGPIDVEHGIVVLRGGVLRDGWEASLARTYRAGARSTRRAGTRWSARADRANGSATSSSSTASAAGVEELDQDLLLEPGMVVAVELDAVCGGSGKTSCSSEPTGPKS